MPHGRACASRPQLPPIADYASQPNPLENESGEPGSDSNSGFPGHQQAGPDKVHPIEPPFQLPQKAEVTDWKSVVLPTRNRRKAG